MSQQESKFFNNQVSGKTLFDKLKGIADNMSDFYEFLAVVGFFRSTGYLKLQNELKDVKKIKVLVGINLDELFKKYTNNIFNISEEETKNAFAHSFKKDIDESEYVKEIDDSIQKLCDDLESGRLEIRIHRSKKIHAKFYLCLPKNHNEHTDGWVIMGSSNISDAGLGLTKTPQYELNVAMKDYGDVCYCREQFDELWEESIEITNDDVVKFKEETYLNDIVTPYELYIKVLIDILGEQIEDDFSIELPDGVKELKYQRDAVVQGYQMLLRNNGLILADVVGLGKTMIATMIAKRFIEANGSATKILVVCPPALKRNWEDTFKLFSIKKKAQIVTNFQLDKVINGEENYNLPEVFNLVIVDEAHGFRNDNNLKYASLQQICKSACDFEGNLNSSNKKVILLSATPLNNKPDDLLNQILLFQNKYNSTIDGIPNLDSFFDPLIKKYNELMKGRADKDISEEVDKIYEEIRIKVLEKITIRRTRNNIQKDEYYRKDLESQGIVFPELSQLCELNYKMNDKTKTLFYDTLLSLTTSEEEDNIPHLHYARYRAIEFLVGDARDKYKEKDIDPSQISKSLAGIYRVLMVKRLESSFYAFRKSLDTLLRITKQMIEMFDNDKILIIPKLNVTKLLEDDIEIDEIIKKAEVKGYEKDDILFNKDDFDPKYIELLHSDKKLLEDLIGKWKEIDKDPKFDMLQSKLDNELFENSRNPESKLLIFSESVDTLNYLYDKLKETRSDILFVSSKNRSKKASDIRKNFDANIDDNEKENKYNILLASDVLAEGVNLHRSNIIVNYDSPWNATRLMQRIGRVNRIGSKASHIYNYMFYPSQEGDKEIQLYKNALIKLQGFHSAFGEDSKIYSKEEIVKTFTMFENNPKDTINEHIALTRELRNIYEKDRSLYNRIKKLPLKSRVLREHKDYKASSVIFISSKYKKEFYLKKDNDMEPTAISFSEAIKYLKADKEEEASRKPFPDIHYQGVKIAIDKYRKERANNIDTNSINTINKKGNKTDNQAINILKVIDRETNIDTYKIKAISDEISYGAYNKLSKNIVKSLTNKGKIISNHSEISKKIDELYRTYTNKSSNNTKANDVADEKIILSEYFI